ncbi:calcium/manganese antiporter SLC30A10-like [Leptodactylus fuscus]|uniref:calcium/manganese antiporter SLC30A10-like n=1 Tax=Leptodactylus fuscus TaxID=238119 RepID=UPI003F4F334B
MGRYSGRSARLLVMCVVHFFLFIAELVMGYIGNSLSLSSDGFAVLSHLISMIIGLFGVKYSRVQWHQRNTYGFLRADAVGAFGNSIFAAALMFSIFIEAIKRFIAPEKTDNALLVLIGGVVGLAINVLNYVIFLDCCFPKKSGDNPDLEKALLPTAWEPWYRGKKGILISRDFNVKTVKSQTCHIIYTQHSVSSLAIGDHIENESDLESEMDKVERQGTLNIRGVLLHVMGDALGSVVVVVAAVIFYVRPLPDDAECNWQCYIDPSLTIVMVVIILCSVFPLIRETATTLLQMVPKGINTGEIGHEISMIPGVKSIHEIHIWELARGKNIATLHVKFQSQEDYTSANRSIRKIFHAHGVHAVTLQAELTGAKDFSLECSNPCISKKCDENLCCSQELVPFSESDGHALKKGKSSHVWYRSDEAPFDPMCVGTPEVKAIPNGLNSKNEGLKADSTRF